MPFGDDPRPTLKPGVAALRFTAWMRERALPFWLSVGWDSARGGFVEQLGPNGMPDADAARRVRVQARQIYVLAHARTKGWCDPGRLIEEGLDYLTAHAWAPDGRPGWVRCLDTSGTVLDPVRDLYDQAFLLLALAWAYRATGDGAILDSARRTLSFLDEEMADPRHGGYVEALPPVLPRRQNPHMHLFEAALALEEATGAQWARDFATRMKALFDTHFFDAATGVLREYFTDAWAPASGQPGRIVEPGHHMEWVWLLHRHAARAGGKPPAAADALFAFADRWGRNPATGLLVDQLDVDGAVIRSCHRIWPQTELIRATLVRHEDGAAGALDAAEAAIGALHRHCLDPAPEGAWLDRIDAEGRPMSGPIPASTLYHLFGAAVETDRVMCCNAGSVKTESAP